jgi:hypothetical protein
MKGWEIIRYPPKPVGGCGRTSSSAAGMPDSVLLATLPSGLVILPPVLAPSITQGFPTPVLLSPPSPGIATLGQMAKPLACAGFSVKLATPTQKTNVELFTPMNRFAGINPTE